MPLAPGTRFGPYEVVAPLGAGGMGEVYRARDDRLGREVAIKVLPAATSCDPEHLDRFEREARAAAALNHRNIVTVHDVGTHQGAPYLVTELVAGETLRRRLARGPLAPGEAVDVALQVTRGTAAAHAVRVVHRDLKPENLIVGPGGEVKILDFGVAKLRPEGGAEDTTLAATGRGVALGTLPHMAPEQVRGEPVDGRADLFAIGTLLYEMLTGVSPFARSTAAATAAAVLHEEPPPVTALTGEPPSSLRRLVEHCLAKDPAERFQSARDLVFALESAAAELAQGRTRVSSPAGGSAEGSAPPSIAVLPFADMSPTRDQEYFCEGLAEELLNALSRIEGLRVAARSASFQFRGSGIDPRAAGQRLGVAAVLEGSVRKAGDQLRVTVRLIDVGDGYQRWSERFDRKLEDVFAIQDEIASCVVGCYGDFLAADARRSDDRPATRAEAYDLYLRGRFLIHTLRRSTMEEAEAIFRRALELDPGYAPAWAGIAEVRTWLHQWWGGDAADLDEAVRASGRALELAPRLAEAHAAHGLALSLLGRYEEAEAELEEATRLDPKLFDAWYYWARTCFAAGHVERSAELFLRAAEVRLEDFQAPLLAAQSLRMVGRMEESEAAVREGIRRAERRLELEPADARALSLGGSSLPHVGEGERGVRWMEKALELYPDEAGVMANAVCLFALVGDRERALDLMARAADLGFRVNDWVANDPDYDSLRDDPRFREIAARAAGRPGSDHGPAGKSATGKSTGAEGPAGSSPAG